MPRRNPFQAELALREMGTPSLLVLVDYLELLADVRQDKFDRAAVRWHGRLELETPLLTLAELQLALAALGALREGDHAAAAGLRRLLRKVAAHAAAAVCLGKRTSPPRRLVLPEMSIGALGKGSGERNVKLLQNVRRVRRCGHLTV